MEQGRVEYFKTSRIAVLLFISGPCWSHGKQQFGVRFAVTVAILPSTLKLGHFWQF